MKNNGFWRFRLAENPSAQHRGRAGVLGSILLDPRNSLDKLVALNVKLESFYDQRHQTLFGQLLEMSLTTAAMDAITIGQWLKEKKVLEKVGGYDYLVGTAR